MVVVKSVAISSYLDDILIHFLSNENTLRTRLIPLLRKQKTKKEYELF